MIRLPQVRLRKALTTSYIDDTVLPEGLTWSLGVQHEIYRNGVFGRGATLNGGLGMPVQIRCNNISAFARESHR